MKPSKELVQQWTYEADMYARKQETPFLHTYSTKLAELAAAWGEQQSLDGKRYRFVRDVPYTDYIHNVMSFQKNSVMDAAIDAAMKG